MRDSNVVFISLGAVAAILAACGVAGFLYFQEAFVAATSSDLEKPAILDSSGVTLGKGLFEKTVHVSNAGLRRITDIRYGRFLPDHGDVLAVASRNGAVFFDATGSPVHSVSFREQVNHVDIIATGPDEYAFLNRGSWTVAASLIDFEGTTEWSYAGSAAVDDMCAGDLDGDGVLEFAVGFNGRGGIHLVDSSGRQQWSKDGANIWHVEIVDTTGNGTMKIVHSDAGGRMTVRDANGDIVVQSKPKPYFSKFSLLHWPTATNRPYALVAEKETAWIFDFDGSVAARYSAPGCDSHGEPRGVTARLSSSELDYLAVLVNYSHWGSSMFYVYDSNENLVFHEIIPEPCAAIATLRNDGTDRDTILVGGTDTIWAYRMQ